MKLQLIQNQDFDFGELQEYYYVALTRKDDPDDDTELLHLAFTRKDIERAQYRTQKNPDMIPLKYAKVLPTNGTKWWQFWQRR
jgi:hypothetical protein|tara:strand:+ start:254 stop:502 length:249 start_codon:yes stop_codon:yes gene_type:complete